MFYYLLNFSSFKPLHIKRLRPHTLKQYGNKLFIQGKEFITFSTARNGRQILRVRLI